VDSRLARDPGAGVSSAPVGIFDSGVGGLTVARAILDQLPGEPVHYLGDTARTPYGPRPLAEVRAFSLELMDRLVDDGVKALVIACNAASSACLRDARERYPVPVVEVIHPAVRRAVATTRNGKVGVIGTQVTIASRSYEDAFAAAPHLQLTTVACPQFVDFVERGDTVSDELRKVAADYLAPIVAADCDTVVLGCTHYPLLTGVISYVVGPDVTLVSSAEETAIDVYRVLAQHDLLRDPAGGRPAHRFTATGDPASFETLGRRFLGPEIGSVGGAPAARPALATTARSS
jgi:glutamate racemase